MEGEEEGGEGGGGGGEGEDAGEEEQYDWIGCKSQHMQCNCKQLKMCESILNGKHPHIKR